MSVKLPTSPLKFIEWHPLVLDLGLKIFAWASEHSDWSEPKVNHTDDEVCSNDAGSHDSCRVIKHITEVSPVTKVTSDSMAS